MAWSVKIISSHFPHSSLFFLLFLFSSYSLFPQSLQVSVLLEGAPNAGKTALAASLAKQVILHFSLCLGVYDIKPLLENFHNNHIFAVRVPVCEDLLSGRHGRVHGVCQVQSHKEGLRRCVQVLTATFRTNFFQISSLGQSLLCMGSENMFSEEKAFSCVCSQQHSCYIIRPLASALATTHSCYESFTS